MQQVRSLILFNGGSAGDFLQYLCLAALDSAPDDCIDSTGKVELPQYFKKYCKQVYHQRAVLSDLDWSRVCPVETSHFWWPGLNQVCDNVYFIDYARHCNPAIVNEYVKKRHSNNWSKMMEYHRSSLPAEISARLNLDNAHRMFDVLWYKNIQNWRQLKFQAIDFYQIIDADYIITLVQTLIQQPVVNQEQVIALHQKWMSVNAEFVADLLNRKSKQ